MNKRKHIGAGGKYRFGFNSKENDGETVATGEGTQDYGMRIYNPALGKFLSVDPIALNYPELSCYQYASNSPIVANDIDGKEMTFYEAQVEDNSLLKIMDHEELAERRYKEGRGYAIATVVVADLVIFKGWLGRTLGFYFLGEAVGNGEKSYEAKSRGDVAKSKEYADRSKDAYIGVALSYGPNILVKGTGAIYRNVKSAIVAVEEDGFAIVKDANGVNAGSAYLTDGQLNLSIKTNGTQFKGRGNEVFKELFNYVNNNFDKITSIRGTWRAGQMGANMKQFNEYFKKYLSEGMTTAEAEVKAAQSTFTGQNAKNLGFSNVKVERTTMQEGSYTEVDVVFTKE